MKKTDICKKSRQLLWKMLEETHKEEFSEETRIVRRTLLLAIEKLQDLHFDLAMEGELD